MRCRFASVFIHTANLCFDKIQWGTLEDTFQLPPDKNLCCYGNSLTESRYTNQRLAEFFLDINQILQTGQARPQASNTPLITPKMGPQTTIRDNFPPRLTGCVKKKKLLAEWPWIPVWTRIWTKRSSTCGHTSNLVQFSKSLLVGADDSSVSRHHLFS